MSFDLGRRGVDPSNLPNVQSQPRKEMLNSHGQQKLHIIQKH